MSTKVYEENAEWEAMKPDWDRVDALMGGTNAMREAGEKYLPRFEMECESDYEKRLSCATLYPAYSETVQNMTARVFYRPTNRDEVAVGLQDDIKNIDLQGNDLDVFAADLFSRGLSHGLCHVLIDYPKTAGLSKRADGVVTQADINASKARPYARIVRPIDLIGWIVDRVDNVDTLVQIRIRKTATVRDGKYGVKTVDRVRVIEPNLYELWEKQEKANGKSSEWVLIEEGPLTLGQIPLVTYYTGRTGTLTAKPPMLELAHLNIKHWQEQSDQDASVRFARVRIVYATGLDADTKLSASAESIICLPQGGTIEVVQGSAESVTVGANSLRALEDQMKEANARLLVKSSSTTKAVAQAKSDAVVEQSQLGAKAQALEDALDQVLQFMAMFRGIEDGGHVDVNDDFDAFDDQSTGVEALVKLVAAGVISEETAFNECKRRGAISNEIEWESEQERIMSGETNAVPA